MGGDGLFKGVRATKSGTIEITFQYQGKRCKERFKLKPTPSNLARVSRHREEIVEAIALGKFDYATTFPNSKRASRFPNCPGQFTTFKEYARKWWNNEAKYLKASTIAGDKRILFNQLVPAFGDTTLSELEWRVIREWIQLKGVAPKTENNILSVLRRALNDAVEGGYIEHNPLDGKKIRRRKGRSTAKTSDKIDPFDNMERQALIRKADGQMKNLIQFGFWSGLRLSEIFALEWSNVDFVNGRVFVEGALTQHSKDIESTKTEAGERAVLLLPPALQAVMEQKQFTFLAGGEVFQNPHTGKRWTGDLALRHSQWKTLCKRAGVRYRPPKQMRHTFASMCLMSGESPQWVAQQMGHTDWTFTAKRYYRWIPGDAGDAGKKVHAKWGGTGKRGRK